MRTHLLTGAVLLTVLSVGCGGGMSSPLSPTATAPAVTQAAGATVTGNVRLGATAGIGSASDPLKVQVVGTDIVATVSLAGQFVLNGVPGGLIQLHFFGAGIDAYVTLSAIAAGESVTITVTVVGSTAVVDTQERKASGGSEEQVEGRIESLPPTVPAGSLVVAGRTVTTSPTTVIRRRGQTLTFADLAIGQRVHVKGTVTGTTFTASIIEVQNTQTGLPVNANGLVESLTGSELAFQFVIGSRTIRGDHLTTFFGSGNRLHSFTNLANGVRVEVKGQQRDGFIYAERIHINSSGNDEDGEEEEDDDDDDGEDEDDEFEVEGALAGLSGTCPAISFTVRGTSIFTDATTRFEDTTCGALRNGDRVEVEGTRQADRRVKASKVEKKR